MNPNAVFSASLVSSLVLWYPSMQACLRGDLDLTPAALRYLAALAASRLAIGFLARLVNAYRTPERPQAPAAETPVPDQRAPAGPPRRRAADRQPGNDSGADDPASLAA